MISPLRFERRRVATLVRLGAACLMFIVICSFSMVWFVLRGERPACQAVVPLPMALTLGPRWQPVNTTAVRRPPHSGADPDTPSHHSRTPRKADGATGPHTGTPSAPCDHETEDAISARQKKPIRPSRSGHPVPVSPEERRARESAPRPGQAAELGNAGQPAGASDDFVPNDRPPRPARRTGRP